MREREADRTTRISRTQRLAIARAQEEGATFIWPAPPYYDFAEAVPPHGEECILTFADGEKASGTLKSFLPEYEVL